MHASVFSYLSHLDNQLCKYNTYALVYTLRGNSNIL